MHDISHIVCRPVGLVLTQWIISGMVHPVTSGHFKHCLYNHDWPTQSRGHSSAASVTECSLPTGAM